jgi:hypothetical protein
MSDEPQATSSAPVVFLSYSHDSREHKQWVAHLATALMEKGIQVIFDQWDLEPGDDVPKFMERAVKQADRVLMVCTEPYVRKANDGKGGVGYEAMIVTGELVRDLGTRKFVPIIRQGGEEPTVPDCVSTRLWVNFSKDDDFDSEMEELIKSLHKTQQHAKPPLGANPFAGLSIPTDETRSRQLVSDTGFGDALVDASTAYQIAGRIAATDDTPAWRKLMRAQLRRATSELVAWRNAEPDLPTYSEKDPSPLYDHAEKGVTFFMPLIASLIAGAESGKDEFSNQLGWIDEVLNTPGWERSGCTYWVEFPELVIFVGQALVGGMLMEAKASEAAVELARTRVQDRSNRRESNPLFRDTGVIGWPDSMNHTCTVAWGFLTRLIDTQEWITVVFGSVHDARAAVSSHYQLLSFLNFCHLSANGGFEENEPSWPITVPLNFCSWPSDSIRKGYQVFLGHRTMLKKLLAANDLEDPEKLQQEWIKWMEICGKWLAGVFRWHFRRDVPQINLPADLEVKGLSLAGL